MEAPEERQVGNSVLNRVRMFENAEVGRDPPEIHYRTSPHHKSRKPCFSPKVTQNVKKFASPDRGAQTSFHGSSKYYSPGQSSTGVVKSSLNFNVSPGFTRNDHEKRRELPSPIHGRTLLSQALDETTATRAIQSERMASKPFDPFASDDERKNDVHPVPVPSSNREAFNRTSQRPIPEPFAQARARNEMSSAPHRLDPEGENRSTQKRNPSGSPLHRTRKGPPEHYRQLDRERRSSSVPKKLSLSKSEDKDEKYEIKENRNDCDVLRENTKNDRTGANLEPFSTTLRSMSRNAKISPTLTPIRNKQSTIMSRKTAPATAEKISAKRNLQSTSSAEENTPEKKELCQRYSSTGLAPSLAEHRQSNRSNGKIEMPTNACSGAKRAAAAGHKGHIEPKKYANSYESKNFSSSNPGFRTQNAQSTKANRTEISKQGSEPQKKQLNHHKYPKDLKRNLNAASVVLNEERAISSCSSTSSGRSSLSTKELTGIAVRAFEMSKLRMEPDQKKTRHQKSSIVHMLNEKRTSTTSEAKAKGTHIKKTSDSRPFSYGSAQRLSDRLTRAERFTALKKKHKAKVQAENTRNGEISTNPEKTSTHPVFGYSNHKPTKANTRLRKDVMDDDVSADISTGTDLSCVRRSKHLSKLMQEKARQHAEFSPTKRKKALYLHSEVEQPPTNFDTAMESRRPEKKVPLEVDRIRRGERSDEKPRPNEEFDNTAEQEYRYAKRQGDQANSQQTIQFDSIKKSKERPLKTASTSFREKQIKEKFHNTSADINKSLHATLSKRQHSNAARSSSALTSTQPNRPNKYAIDADTNRTSEDWNDNLEYEKRHQNGQTPKDACDSRAMNQFKEEDRLSSMPAEERKGRRKLYQQNELRPMSSAPQYGFEDGAAHQRHHDKPELDPHSSFRFERQDQKFQKSGKLHRSQERTKPDSDSTFLLERQDQIRIVTQQQKSQEKLRREYGSSLRLERQAEDVSKPASRTSPLKPKERKLPQVVASPRYIGTESKSTEPSALDLTALLDTTTKQAVSNHWYKSPERNQLQDSIFLSDASADVSPCKASELDETFTGSLNKHEVVYTISTEGSSDAGPDAFQWLHKKYGTQTPAVSNRSSRNKINQSPAGRAKFSSRQHVFDKIKEEEDDDIFFGLDDEESALNAARVKESEQKTRTISSRSDTMLQSTAKAAAVPKFANLPQGQQTSPDRSSPNHRPSPVLRTKITESRPSENYHTRDNPVKPAEKAILECDLRPHSGKTIDALHSEKSVTSDITSSLIVGNRPTYRFNPDVVIREPRVVEEPQPVSNDELSLQEASADAATSVLQNLSSVIVNSLKKACTIPDNMKEYSSCAFDAKAKCADRVHDAWLAQAEEDDILENDENVRLPSFSEVEVAPARVASNKSTLSEVEQRIRAAWEKRDRNPPNDSVDLRKKHAHTKEILKIESVDSSDSDQKEEQGKDRIKAQAKLLEHADKAMQLHGVYNERGYSMESSTTWQPKPMGTAKDRDVSPSSRISGTTSRLSGALSFEQRSVLEKFSSSLKKEGVEVLKLGRRNKWQIRYLTVSTEVTKLDAADTAGDIGQCPQALLWPKQKTEHANSVSTIKENGRGGVLFTHLKQVRATVSNEYYDKHLSQKLKKIFPVFAGVVLDYHHDGGDRQLHFCFKTKIDAQAFLTAMLIIKDAISTRVGGE